MIFEEYYRIMKEHGICELFFLYRDRECSVIMHINGLKLHYFLDDGVAFHTYDCLDDLVLASVFDGKSLRDVWDEIEILTIDGVGVKDYDVETCSFDYIAYLKEQGELQWSCCLGVKRSFLLNLKYALIGVIPFLILGMLFPIFHLSNWNFLLLIGFAACFALTVATIALLKNKQNFNYQITDKKVFVYKGLDVSTTYDNIKRVKLKRSIFHKNIGTVKLYLKKGLSINYSLERIPYPEKACELILENMKKQSE